MGLDSSIRVFTAIAVIHAQARTTAKQKAILIQTFPDPEAMAKNAAKKSKPVAAEYTAQAGFFSAAKRRAKTRHDAINPRNPTPPLTKCMRPCVLMVRGGPCGVPGGKPSAGSATKMPAAIRPNPYALSSNGPHVRPGDALPDGPADSSPKALRSPAAQIMTSNPVITKFEI